MPCGCPAWWFWSRGSSQILPDQLCNFPRVGPRGALGDPSEPLRGSSSLSSLQVGLLEVLVGKIFDLAFLPAMNGESYARPPQGCVAWGLVAAGLAGIILDTQPFCRNRISENFILSLFI